MNSAAEILHSLQLPMADYESQIHDAIIAGFDAAGVTYGHEVVIGPRCRIDFEVETERLGIEVKKGKPNSRDVARQLERYAATGRFDRIIIVVERAIFQPPTEVGGVPVEYIALVRNWGIALP